MLPLLLLAMAGIAGASPISISPVFVTASPLSLSYEVIDPSAGGLRLMIEGGPLGVQSYSVGGYLLLPIRPAIIGDTAAFGLTTQHGALLGLFLVRYNDGLACASALCNLYPNHEMNITHIQPGFLPDGTGGTFGPSEIWPQVWMNGRLTVDAFGFLGAGHTTITYTLPYRNVVPEPGTALLVSGLLAMLIGGKKGRARSTRS